MSRRLARRRVALAVAAVLAAGATATGLAAGALGASASPAATAGSTPTGRLTTVVGSAGSGAALAVAQQPSGLSLGPSDTVLVTDDGANVIRQLGLTGSETVLAGTLLPSYNGDARPAGGASLDSPEATALVTDGVAIADTFNQRIRYLATSSCSSSCPFGLKSTTRGDLYTIAGTGVAGTAGIGGPATAAELNGPTGLAVDPAGDLLVSDTYADEVLLLAAANCSSRCSYGLSSTVAGRLYDVAGTGGYSSSGNDGPATSAGLAVPGGLAVNAVGDLAVADAGNNEIRLVADQSCSTGCPFGFRSLEKGDIYGLAGTTRAGDSGNGGRAASAELDGPSAVAVDASGDVVVADALNHVIRLVAASACSSGCPFGLTSTTAGDIYTVAGDGTAGDSGNGGPARQASFEAPSAVLVDSAGNLIVADPSTGQVREVAASSCTKSCRYGLHSTVADDVYTIAGDGAAWGSGAGGPASRAELSVPGGAAADGRGDVVVADTGDNEIRLVAGASCRTHCPFGLSTTAGDLYTLAGTGVAGSAGDSGQAGRAELSGPLGVAVGASDDVVVADTGNNRLRLIAAESCTSHCPYGLGRIVAGDIYALAGTGSPGSAGDGGPARRATFTAPAAVVVGPSGDLVVADTGDNRVRLVAAASCRSHCPYGLARTVAGDVYTIAGRGVAGYSGDGHPARTAELSRPSGLAVGPSGDLLVADSLNNRVRLVGETACHSGCPYGLKSVAVGDIYTVAGSGGFGQAGDGGAATSAQLAFPTGLAVGPAGNLFVADLGGNEIRVVWNEHCLGDCLYGAKRSSPGQISLVAGNGNLETAPDGQPAAGRPLAAPAALASSPSGILVVEVRHDAIRRLSAEPEDGYQFVNSTGGVHNFGSPFYGSLRLKAPARIVGIASAGPVGGYWLVESDGAVYPFGGAVWYGSLHGKRLGSPIAGIVGRPGGGGYWLFERDGAVYPFGAARSHGSLAAKHLAKPVVGMAASRSGDGYWLMTSAGQVYGFGDAHDYGSASHLTDLVGIVGCPSGPGYWLVASNGRVLGFGGAHVWGSLLSTHVSSPVVAMSADPVSGGYRLVTAQGGVYPFHAPGYGTAGRLSGVVGLSTGE